VSTTVTPICVTNTAFGHDDVLRRVYTFGGAAAGMTLPDNRTWFFDFVREEWSPVEAQGTLPSTRLASTGAYDTLNNRFIIHAGAGYSDTHELR